jgi:hypothetical protein
LRAQLDDVVPRQRAPTYGFIEQTRGSDYRCLLFG